MIGQITGNTAGGRGTVGWAGPGGSRKRVQTDERVQECLGRVTLGARRDNGDLAPADVAVSNAVVFTATSSCSPL